MNVINKKLLLTPNTMAQRKFEKKLLTVFRTFQDAYFNAILQKKKKKEK